MSLSLRPAPTLAILLLAAALAAPAAAAPITPLVIPNPASAPSQAAAPANASGLPTAVAGFTAAQASRGAAAYGPNCDTCHGPNLNDGEFGGPPLIGEGFQANYFHQTADSLFGFMSSAMPADRPGSLTPQQYADIMAYIMSRNGIAAGPAELPSDIDALAKLTLQ